MKRLGFLLVPIVILFTACIDSLSTDRNSFSEFHHIDRTEWLYSDNIVFQADSLRDSTLTGTLLLSIRHTAAYPYSNIWIEISHKDEADSSICFVDTLDVVLANQFGHWYGKGMGSSLQLTDTISNNFRLVRGVPLTVRHIMRVDTLYGIEQIGVIFTPTNTAR